jgi:hypothetical protein
MFPRFYKIFNYSTIGIVAIFLILVLTETIPKETYLTLLIVTIVIFLARIILRVYLHFYLQKSKGE